MLRWINMHSRRLMTLGDTRTWNNLNMLSTCITEPQWARRAYLAVCLGGKVHIFYLAFSSLFSNGSVALLSPGSVFTRHDKAPSIPFPHPKPPPTHSHSQHPRCLCSPWGFPTSAGGKRVWKWVRDAMMHFPCLWVGTTRYCISVQHWAWKP